MATIIPRAIGLGISEKDTWTMTPAEIIEAITTRSKEVMHQLKFFDFLNAKSIANNLVVHGVEDIKTADYLTLPPEPEKKRDIAQDPKQRDFLIKLFAAVQEREARKHG
jgi:hypothetical protein